MNRLAGTLLNIVFNFWWLYRYRLCRGVCRKRDLPHASGHGVSVCCLLPFRTKAIRNCFLVLFMPAERVPILCLGERTNPPFRINGIGD
ncbi:hypothetical protein CEXT_542911 [Caerostris extrusa]|uniref:Secreted protein n=1 Tax=Caerostris extrusa TaxID=172846 RepID=A0AAV4NQF4_CAEEX|nr:hypothetical protein CEXT_542911 [Caerostris extrusa]